MAHYGPEEWWYADGTLAVSVAARVFGPGNDNVLAPIFSDAGLSIPLANPTATDVAGLLEFYAADGEYWIFVGDENYGDSVLVTLGPVATGAVLSVNGQTGVVVLGASDVGAQPIATINAKGDLYAGTGNDATTRQAVGANGEVLTADSAQPTGMKWAASGGSVASVNGQTGVVVLTASDVGAAPTTRTLTAGTAMTGGGDLSADRTFNVNVGTTAGTVAAGDDSRIAGAQQRSALTTKGDLYVATASATTTREPVGSDGQVLTADSVQATGMKWATPASAPVTSVNSQTGAVVLTSSDVGAQPIATIDAKGDLYAGTANDATARLAVGTNNQVLRANSAQSTGLEYHTLVAADVGAVAVDSAANIVYGTTTAGATLNREISTIASADTVAWRTGEKQIRSDTVADGDPAADGHDLTNRTYVAGKIAGGIPASIVDAKGDLIAATANDVPARLAVGTDGQYLRAASAQSTGLEYHTVTASDVGAVPTTRTLTAGTAMTGGGDLSADRTFNVNIGTTAGTAAAGDDSRITGAQQKSTLTTKGDLYVATASAVTTRLPVGSDTQVLSANSAQATGLEWVAAGGGGIPATIFDVKGDIIAASAADTAARLAAGSDGQVLRAASAQTTGLEYHTLVSSDVGAQPIATLTTKGDLYVATAASTVTRQGVGTNGYVVVADSAQTNGLKWATEKSFSFMPRSTGYISANGVTTARSSKAATANTMFLLPFMLLIDATTSSIAFEITGNVATAVARLGFYALDATTLLPTGAAVVDFGTTTADTTSTKTFAAVQALTAGGWALAIVGQTASPTLRHCSGFNPLVASATFPAGTGLGWNNGWAQTGVTGGLPTIGSIVDTDTPMCGIKF